MSFTCLKKSKQKTCFQESIHIFLHFTRPACTVRWKWCYYNWQVTTYKANADKVYRVQDFRVFWRTYSRSFWINMTEFTYLTEAKLIICHFVPSLSHLNLWNGNPVLRVLVQHFQDQIFQVFTDSWPEGYNQASVRGLALDWFINDLYLYKSYHLIYDLFSLPRTKTWTVSILGFPC